MGEHRPGGPTTAEPDDSDVSLASRYGALGLGPEQYDSGPVAEMESRGGVMNRLRSSRRWRRSLDSDADMSHTWPAFMADMGGTMPGKESRRSRLGWVERAGSGGQLTKICRWRSYSPKCRYRTGYDIRGLISHRFALFLYKE